MTVGAFTYRCVEGEWSCSYMGMTGKGSTPEEARSMLLVISQLMCAPWHQAPVQ